jgi:hypothetical protein
MEEVRTRRCDVLRTRLPCRKDHVRFPYMLLTWGPKDTTQGCLSFHYVPFRRRLRPCESQETFEHPLSIATVSPPNGGSCVALRHEFPSAVIVASYRLQTVEFKSPIPHSNLSIRLLFHREQFQRDRLTCVGPAGPPRNPQNKRLKNCQSAGPEICIS